MKYKYKLCDYCNCNIYEELEEYEEFITLRLDNERLIFCSIEHAESHILEWLDMNITKVSLENC